MVPLCHAGVGGDPSYDAIVACMSEGVRERLGMIPDQVYLRVDRLVVSFTMRLCRLYALLESWSCLLHFAFGKWKRSKFYYTSFAGNVDPRKN